MAVTFTIGTLGAGTIAALAGGALGGVALAGAIGLGVAGLAKKFGGGRRSGRRGHGRRRGGHHYRGKRAIDDETVAVQNLLQVIREEDITGCGLKLVCELAGVREEELFEEEEAILSLIGPVVKPGEGVLPPGGAGDYMAAKSFGQVHGNCAEVFPMCPFNGTELMGAVNNFLP